MPVVAATIDPREFVTMADPSQTARAVEPDETVRVSGRMALFVTTLSSFLTPYMSSSVSVAIPSIGREFAMADSLAAAMFLAPFGRISDIHGRKKVLLLGRVVHTAASLLSGLANAGGVLIALRALQGLGAAMMFGTSTTILTSAFPPRERGRMLGINVAAVYTGLSVGPSVGSC